MYISRRTISSSDSYFNPINVVYLSVGQIEDMLLAHNISGAFVLPEPIADIVQTPALQFLNGAPVYHVVAETYGTSILIIHNIILFYSFNVD